MLLICSCGAAFAQAAAEGPKRSLKDEMRMPWQRSDTRFIRNWLILGPVPGRLDVDPLQSLGGEANQAPIDAKEIKLPNVPAASWHGTKAWGNTVVLDLPPGAAEEGVFYAFAKVSREKEGKALLSIGSKDGVRAWVNGQLVLSKDAPRSLMYGQDQVEIDLHKGDNSLLVKLSANQGPGLFSARILETGTVLSPIAEIGPSLLANGPDSFTLKTDDAQANGSAADVQVEVVAPGGKVMFSKGQPRGASLEVSASKWPDGPYEVRCSTRKANGLLYVQHLPWYKGDCLPKAVELLQVAAASDASTPEGMTLRMLAEMVENRLGCKPSAATGNPWAKIHSPLMEFDELMLERTGQAARVRAHGFYRLAYRDEVDGSPQFCRAYLPADYSPARKWPLVIQLHGYNPANPRYVGWWAADSRHPGIDAEFPGHGEVIYMEPHGRGNVQYLYLGDQDVVRAVAEAKKHFSVDEDRVYLTGDSMGGWGTWNVGTRHPELFAAIAPVFGGVDYHSQMTEEELARLDPAYRFYWERTSTWATADSLLNMPILVHQGDADQAVNVEYSRWGVRLLQRWGYDVRYHEYPGYGHESLLGEGNASLSIEWFLRHTRRAAPTHVRVRSTDLRTAAAYWVRVDQMESPGAFMVVDAEVLNRGLIRLDTQNVGAVTLSPAASLINPSRPVRIVWNGRAREARVENGCLQLLADGCTLAGLVKRPALPGALLDLISTPYAIVIGTIARDADMREQCEQRARTFASSWREGQKQEPRVFKDTELGEADMARYSLLLVGGPGENAIAARLVDRLPLKVNPDGFVIDGRSFPARDAALSLIFPNPLNPDRYVSLIAPTSADGLWFVEPTFANIGYMEPGLYDFIIQDGRIPVGLPDASPDQVRVLSGYFDSHWRLSSALLLPGDEVIRAKCRVVHRPRKDYVLEAPLLAAYPGSYQIDKGPLVAVAAENGRLTATIGDEHYALLFESNSDFFIQEANVHIAFTRDASGKVTGATCIQGAREFTAKKL